MLICLSLLVKELSFQKRKIDDDRVVCGWFYQKRKMYVSVYVLWEKREMPWETLEHIGPSLVHFLQVVLAQQIIPAAPEGGWLNEEVSSPGSVCSLPAPSFILPRQAAHIVQPLFSCQAETFTYTHTVTPKQCQPFVFKASASACRATSVREKKQEVFWPPAAGKYAELISKQNWIVFSIPHL